MRDAVSDVDRKFWDALPDEFEAFWGYCAEDGFADSLSWTIDRAVADAFARGHRGRYAVDPIVARRTVRTADVQFAINDRNEYEVLLTPMASPVTSA